MIRLFELRTEKRISQRAIASRFNISQATYNNWENGKTQPSIDQLKALAEFYGVSVDYLIGNSDDLGNISYDGDRLSDEEKFLIKTFRSLPQEAKSGLILFMQGLLR